MSCNLITNISEESTNYDIDGLFEGDATDTTQDHAQKLKARWDCRNHNQSHGNSRGIQVLTENYASSRNGLDAFTWAH